MQSDITMYEYYFNVPTLIFYIQSFYIKHENMSDMLGLSEIFESPFTLCQMFVMLNCGIVTFLYSFICRTCLLLKRATLAAKADLQQDLGQGGTAGAGLGFDQHAL